MAWPPAPSSSFLSTSTTVQWGTDEILIESGVTYIVKSIRSTDTQEVIYIENGTGLRAIRIQLWQGREVEITVVADDNFTHPSPESSVQVTDPLSGTLMTFKSTANAYNAARKVEGERVISAVFDTLIEGGGSPPPI